MKGVKLNSSIRKANWESYYTSEMIEKVSEKYMDDLKVWESVDQS